MCSLVAALGWATTESLLAAGLAGHPFDAGVNRALHDDTSVSAAGVDARSAWEAFFPPPDAEFDWIQLKSDEWLKGEVKALYGYRLEFDSDELGLLTLDWEDIKRLRTAKPRAVRIEIPGDDRSAATKYGVLTLTRDGAYVGSGADARQIVREDIVSIATGERKELDYWSGKVSLGANYRSGNSELVDQMLTASAKRRTSLSQVTLDYRSNFSRSEGVETLNNHRFGGTYDIFETTRFFWRPVAVEYYRDQFKNIDHQLGLGTGAGYHITRTARTEWDVFAGIGGLYKDFSSVEPGKDETRTSHALAFGTTYDTELTGWLDFLFDYQMQIVDDESGTYIHQLLTTVSTDLVGDLDLEVSLVWDRVESPQREADGTLPDQDDLQLILGIGYEF